MPFKGHNGVKPFVCGMLQVISLSNPEHNHHTLHSVFFNSALVLQNCAKPQITEL